VYLVGDTDDSSILLNIRTKYEYRPILYIIENPMAK